MNFLENQALVKTIAGIIPADWRAEKVGNICNSIVPGRDKPKVFDGDIPWITTPDINGLYVSKSQLNLNVSLEELKRCNGKIIPSGSVIMSCVGEFGIVAINSCDIVINQQLHAFVPHKTVNSIFLLYALKKQKRFMLRYATTTSVPYLKKDNCESIPIPIPPLEEQKKIAEILSTWDRAIALTEKLIAAKQKLKKGLIQKLFNSTNWEKKKLSEVSDKKISYGVVQTGEPIIDGIPCVRVIDLDKSKIDFSTMITTTNEINQSYKKTILEKHDIMLALRGDIGLVKLVDKKLIGCNITRGIARISPKKSIINPHFLLWTIRSHYFRKDLLRKVNGSALKEIPINELRKTNVFIPELEKQKEIAEILITIENYILIK